MIDDIYNKIYPSSRSVYGEEIERNLEYILRDEIKKISRIGFDLLVEISPERLYTVIEKLKENSQLEINNFHGINTYKNEKGRFLLINLKSATGDISVLLKMEVSDEEPGKNYKESIDILKKFYKASAFYGPVEKIATGNYNIRITPGILDGLDCFDLNIYAEEDEVKDAHINTGISRIADDEFYKDMSIHNLIAYISRFDWKAGVFPEVCLCSAFEKLLQLKLPGKAQYTRMLLCELYRVSNHIYFISNICNILQYDIAYNLCLLEREKILRIIETITGSRVAPNFIRIGGVRRDIEGEVISEIRKKLPLIFKNINRIEKIMMNDFLVIERLKDTGTVPKEIALEYGVTGPNLRASGIRYDLRKDKDFISYKDLSFLVPVGRVGDCLDRVLVRFIEIFQSLKLINQITSNFPRGAHIKKINLSNLEFRPEIISQDIECPHGIFKIYMEVGKRNIESLVIKGPSISSLILGEEIIKGSSIEDVELILMSLDISPGEIIST
jgi:NADH-quinone oxidoreductase subunit D